MKIGADYFQQAIEKDPGYALAYSGLADCYSVLSTYVIIPPREGWAKARTAAAAAIALDPGLAEGHASQGFIRTFLDWEWIGAEKEFQRAAELNPAYWLAPYWYSLLLNGQGRHQEAEQQIRHAQELEPLSPIVAFASGLTSYCARRYAEAIHRCLKGIEIDPTHPPLRMWCGAAYQAQSQYQEAVRELEIGTKLMEGSTLCTGWLAHAHAAAGNRAEAQRLLQTLLDEAERKQVEPFSVILAYLGLGEQEQALNWLEKACDSYPGIFPLVLKTDSRLDELRTNPRFVKVMQRMGLQA
jgi:tetratricopeptide (TPR) repeat protein